MLYARYTESIISKSPIFASKIQKFHIFLLMCFLYSTLNLCVFIQEAYFRMFIYLFKHTNFLNEQYYHKRIFI
jgi:hypothetical protein